MPISIVATVPARLLWLIPVADGQFFFSFPLGFKQTIPPGFNTRTHVERPIDLAWWQLGEAQRGLNKHQPRAFLYEVVSFVVIRLLLPLRSSRLLAAIKRACYCHVIAGSTNSFISLLPICRSSVPPYFRGVIVGLLYTASK
jgi:hypothetical protein